MIKTLNTESLELFGVPFKQLNCGQRMDIYRANNLSEDTIDELEITFGGLESGLVEGDYD
jgi:hypothetical protein